MEKAKPVNKQLKNVQSISKIQMKLDFTDPDDGRRPCKEHSFLTDVADVREMEQGLLQLLNDFHSGKLQAFGQECSFEKMDQVREQQEKLAKLHFELDAQQDRHKLGSEQGRQLVSQNMEKLMSNLEDLSLSIHNLQKNKSKEEKKT